MKKTGILTVFSVLFVMAAVSGCISGVEKLPPKPVHDEVLTYPLPFDLTYLRTLEVLQTIPHWELRLTEKERGLITVYNHAYSKWGDADQRSVTFLLKRVSRNETSISIKPKDQSVPGSGQLLEKINEVLSSQY